MKKTTKIIALMLAVLTAISAFSVSGFAVATKLEAGSSKADAANIPEFGVDYVSSLSTAGEVDWFKFTTLSEDAYYHFYFENYSLTNTNTNWSTDSPNLYLYDANMKELKHSFTDSDKKDSFSLKLENNTEYYFKVLMGSNEQDSTGNYEISVTVAYDAVPNEKENSVEIEVNSNNVNSFDGDNDYDWFRFTAPVTGEYDVTLKKCSLPSGGYEIYSPNIYLYNEYDQKLGSDYNCYGEDAFFTVSLEKDETYYLKIYMGSSADTATGNYEFSVTCDGIKSLTGVSVKTMPNKTSYNVGESFDKSGLVVKAEYSDGTSATVTNYTLSGFESSEAGTKTITVSYTENGITKSDSFTVNVVASSEDPDPAPGHQEENDSVEDDGGDVLGTLLGIFTSIINFFIWLINLFTSIIS